MTQPCWYLALHMFTTSLRRRNSERIRHTTIFFDIWNDLEKSGGGLGGVSFCVRNERNV